LAAASVAEALDLPHHRPDAAMAMRFKPLQRERLSAAGLLCPRWHEIRGPADLRPGLEAVGLPAILKPAWGMSSVATFAIGTAEDLASAYPLAVELHARSPRLHGTEPVFLLEERLSGARWHASAQLGDYCSVESIVYRGTPTHITVTDRFPLVPPFREGGALLPSGLPAERRASVLDCATQAIAAVGATDGATHIEIKFTERGPVVIEVNGRVGGGLGDLMLLASDYDLLGEVVRVAAGLAPQPRPRWRGVAWFWWPHGPLERFQVRAVHGLEAVEQHPSVRSVRLLQPPGSVVDGRDSQTWLAKVTAVDPTVDAALATAALVERSLQFDVASID
jgi:biotin carboxylase